MAQKAALSIKAGAMLALLKELRLTAERDEPLVVSGAKELASVLRRELTRGGVASAVREQGPLEGAVALVLVLAGAADEDDEKVLKEATRARMPVVAVVVGGSDAHVPYVLEEHVVRVGAGTGFPVDQIARRLAQALGERATPLAARLPALRPSVCDELIRKFSRQNAFIGLAVFIPGADLPILTLNQVRLVLRIADAHGFAIDSERLPEVIGVICSGLGLRAVARRAIGIVPFVGWAVKGGIAYVGTRTLGEAAVRYFERRAPVTRVAGERVRFPR